MKMTADVTKRCGDMLKNFAERNRITVRVDHEFGEGQTKLWFRDDTGCHQESYHIIWEEASTLSEACATIYADLMVRWNLNSKNSRTTGNPTSGDATLNFDIKDVIFDPPATIVLWTDGTKTVVKCQEGDAYSDEVGLALCIAKKALGNKGNFNNVFRKWVPEVDDSCEPIPTIKDIFERARNALTTMSFDIYKEDFLND